MINIDFIGRLGADAETRQSKSGRSYYAMNVAVDNFSKGERSTTWIRVICLPERVGGIEKYLKKGRPVWVRGTATIGTYTNNAGTTHPDISVMADRIDFVPVSSASGGTASNAAETAQDKTVEPTIAPLQAPEPAPSVANSLIQDEVDDLPF